MKFNEKIGKKNETKGTSRPKGEKKDIITYFKCNKLGHIQQYYPTLKKASKGTK